MAKPRNSSPVHSYLLLLLVPFFFFFFSTTHQQQQQEMNRGGGGLVLGRRTGGGGRLVGGRTKVEDVNTNKEVQGLGKYCVEQYNNRHKSSNGSSIRPAVVFVKVVEAEKQVVSGIKYYLKISAVSGSSGILRTFDAVVVVKPWADSKDMLSFCPSPPLSTK